MRVRGLILFLCLVGLRLRVIEKSKSSLGDFDTFTLLVKISMFSKTSYFYHFFLYFCI